MVDGVRTFDPVAAFQGARERQVGIQRREQVIGQEETKFGQTQATQRATILGQSAQALKGLPIEQRDAAFASIEPQLEQFGIPRGTFQAGQFTDINLDRAITESQAFLGAPSAGDPFTLGPGQQRFGPQGQVIAEVPPAPRAPPVQVGITIPGGKKEQEELAKLRAQDLTNIRAKGNQAERELNQLDILSGIDVQTGRLEPGKQAIASFAEGFGIDASALANVTAGEAFTSESGKLVLSVIERQKGPQTDDDRRAISQTIAKLGNTPQANDFIINSARAFANRSVEQRNFFDDFFAQNDTLKGASRAWNDFKEEVPMVSKFKKTPQGLPVFFFNFKSRVKELNPEASDAEIIQAWKNQEAAARTR